MNKITLKIKKLNSAEFKKYCQTGNIKELHQYKLYLDDIYYNTDNEEVPDHIYDILKDTLVKKDPDYIPPVGAKIRFSDNETKLPFWLGSADKITPDESDVLKRWLLRNPESDLVISEKLDGVSGLLVIRDGVKKLYTRGNGLNGGDISYLIPYFSIPEKLPDISIRGELIIEQCIFDKKYLYTGSRENYKKTKSTGNGFGRTYKNSRSMVSGLISAKTVREGLRDISFVTYEIIGNGEMPKPQKQFKQLKKLGFKTAMNIRLGKIDIEILEKTHKSFKEQTEFEIDGIIIQSNIPYDRNISGNPKYSFAFKMRDTENIAETNVLDIEWSISRYGQIVPVAVFETVTLSGADLSRASLHNASNLVKRKIGPGSRIVVTRSKDVIPFILDVIKTSDTLKMPSKTELNGLGYKWDENKVHLIVNGNMGIMDIKLFNSFFSKLNIKHVSEATITKIYNKGYKTLISIIGITKKQLLEIDGIKEKSADRILKNIKLGLQDITVSLLLGSSSVFGIGIGRKRIDALLTDIPDILKLYKTISPKELLQKIISIEGFSEIMAGKIVENIENADKFVEMIKPYCSFKIETRVSNSLVGKKFVMSGFRDKLLEKQIIERGGKVVGTVSKKTNGLIVIDKEKITSKITKAKASAVKIYTKDEFVKNVL